MAIYPGRGAWTARGKDNGTNVYTYLDGKPMDGSTPDKDINYAAVMFAVKAIQNRLITLGYPLYADGVFGPKTAAAVKQFQGVNGLVADGAVGLKTCRALWHPTIGALESSYSIPRHILWGIAYHESLMDPGAVGATTPGDRGLVQYNTTLGTISPEDAHNPKIALPRAASDLRNKLNKYTGKGADLQLKCSIASWNSPVRADKWFQTGVAPDDQIALYVSDVINRAATY